jgi:ribosomal protein S14
MKLKKAHGTVSEKDKAASVCESCGAEFVCGATQKECWCMDIKLTDENRAELKSEFKDCLCRNCLRKIAEMKN